MSSQRLVQGVTRLQNILKSYSRKIEFGDILKRVQETIRRERAEEKKQKKKRHNNENKQLNQNQINGKMISELKNDMKSMKEIIKQQNEMMKALLKQQQINPTKNLSNDEDSVFEESRISYNIDPKMTSLLPSSSINLQGENPTQPQRIPTYSPNPKDEWD